MQKFIVLLMTGYFCCQLRAEKTLSPGTPETSTVVFNLSSDNPGRLTAFFGSDYADLFIKEVNESFKVLLDRDFVSDTNGGYPLGFLNASPSSQPWYGTMWSPFYRLWSSIIS